MMDDDVDVYPNTINSIYELMKNADIAMVGATDKTHQKSKGVIGYLFFSKSYRYRNVGHCDTRNVGQVPKRSDGNCSDHVGDWAFVSR